MTTNSLYPPSVQGVPPDLTVPSKTYRRQVVIVLISLAIFIIFYLGLVVGSAYIVYWGVDTMINPVQYAPGSNRDWGPTAALIAFIVFLFLARSLVKWRRDKDAMRIEVTEKEHPELFAFIRQICEDTKAPFPLRVYVSPEVNASVSYNSSLLSLIFPVKKNLVIGLGLVDGLNLSEFKAVIAHEFGHFSQSTMRIGSYVYVANHVVYDIVYQRDVLDELLAKARRTNIRIAIFAWAISAVLWVLRKILALAFRIVNFQQSALSRQMEFHADLVAVSITGSDSLIHALKKLDFLSACQSLAYRDVSVAAENRLFTSDFYFHQTSAADHVRALSKDPNAGTSPTLPVDPTVKTQVFEVANDEADPNRMWASHPSNFDREQNAKLVYVRSIEDDRSPWLLFQNEDQLRKQMTELVYKHTLKLEPTSMGDPKHVQQFIDEENAEMDQNERYEGIYDGRPIDISIEELHGYNDENTMEPAQIASLFDALYNTTYKQYLEAHSTRLKEISALMVVQGGAASPGPEVKVQGKNIEFRGESYPKTELDALIDKMKAELDTDEAWFKVFDKDVFQAHLRMAQLTGDCPDGDELCERYRFHIQLQTVMLNAKRAWRQLDNVFEFVSTKNDGLKEKEFAQVSNTLSECYALIQDSMKKSGAILLPALQNVEPGVPLGNLLLLEPLVGPAKQGDKIEPEWISKFAGQAYEINNRSNRIFFKSLGAILAHQEAIAQKYRLAGFEVPPVAILPALQEMAPKSGASELVT